MVATPRLPGACLLRILAAHPPRDLLCRCLGGGLNIYIWYTLLARAGRAKTNLRYSLSLHTFLHLIQEFPAPLPARYT